MAIRVLHIVTTMTAPSVIRAIADASESMPHGGVVFPSPAGGES